MKKYQPVPPTWAIRLLRIICPAKSFEEIEGDLTEEFYRDLRRFGPKRARREFAWNVVRYARPAIVSRNKYSFHLNTLAMFSNYFKIAWRTVTKNLAYSMINVFGLAFGICACLIIYLVVSYEFSFDRFFPDEDRIFRLEITAKSNDKEARCICVPPPTPFTMRQEVSGIETVAGYFQYDPKISVPDGANPPKHFERQTSSLIIAGPEYFDIFQYRWLAGNPRVIKDPFKVVLSESRAHAYFGSVPAHQMIGKEIIYNDSLQVTVAGVVQDWKENTDFRVTEILSMSTVEGSFLKQVIPMDNWQWYMHSSQAFVKLKKGVSRLQTSDLMTASFRKHIPEDKNAPQRVELMPLPSIHFHNNDHEESKLLTTLYALIGLAGFILILAVINFVNLSTAQSLKRVREIGIRKTLGSYRINIVFQFLVETLVLTAFASTVAILAVKPALSFLGHYIPGGASFDISSPGLWVFILSLTFLTTLLAGFYPAQMASAYRPAISLKGTAGHRGSNKWYLRKGLIVFQFAISLFFIVATLVMRDQIRFMQTKDRGFSTHAIATFRTNWNDRTSRTKMLANELKSIPEIVGVALQSVPPMGFAKMTNMFKYKGDTMVETEVSVKAGNSDFITLYGFRFLAGRNIANGDSLRELVINDYYRKVLGFKNAEAALGSLLYFNDKPYPIVGVVEDFHEQSFHEAIGPAVVGHWNEFEHSVAVKFPEEVVASGRAPEIMAQVEKRFKALFPDEPFNYHFVEEEIQWMHEAEQKTESLMNLSMMITIFISCLGIFGLSMYTAEMRTKEIGVRKVLGASVFNIVISLTNEFIVLIAVGICVATPIAWYFMKDWLSKFAYRIDLSIVEFLAAGAIALSVALITMSFHAIKSARANPVESLRTE
ncbi:MAG TPA: ABC transporter permease [Cyclobacteriaceae bacterium]|nr:ABC transporter permease [Cyclobacteriaceae bacterium]